MSEDITKFTKAPLEENCCFSLSCWEFADMLCLFLSSGNPAFENAILCTMTVEVVFRSHGFSPQDSDLIDLGWHWGRVLLFWLLLWIGLFLSLQGDPNSPPRTRNTVLERSKHLTLSPPPCACWSLWARASFQSPRLYRPAIITPGQSQELLPNVSKEEEYN